MKKTRITKKFRLPAALILAWSFIVLTDVYGQSVIQKISPNINYTQREMGYNFIVMGDTRDVNPSESWEYKNVKGWNKIVQDVYHDVVKLLRDDASFALHTGDLVLKGCEEDDWDKFKKLIPSDLRNINKSKFLPALGNHELYQESGEGDALNNYSNTFPFLKDQEHGVYHNYYFVIDNSLFFSLCSGPINNIKDFEHDDRTWNCKAYSYDTVMEQVGKIYDEYTYHGRRIDNIFIQYHKPSFSHSKHPPLDESNDPLTKLLEIKKDAPDLKIFVFNGHIHTTELYNPEDNVYVLVAGGGGAPQKITNKTWEKPSNEIFWKNLKETNKKSKRINYFRVFVDANNDVEIREMCLYIYEEDGHIGFGEGLVIQKDGKITDKQSRRAEVDIDRVIDLYEGRR